MSRINVALEELEDSYVQVIPRKPVSREAYRAFVAANPDLRIERTPEGEVVIMAPVHSRTGRKNSLLNGQLWLWAEQDGRGMSFDCSTGYDLPSGSNRAPDASWVLRARIDALSEEEKQEYYPLCPDFVVELRSKSDRVAALRAKMQEYLANGARLGWLIDPIERTVGIYRPGKPVETLESPQTVSGDPELPGFVLQLSSIWED